MKNLIYIVAIAVFLLQSCGSATSKTTEASSVSQSENNKGGTELLTKAVFLEKVWDYENSPREWKFKGDKPVLIDFYADWCGPCRKAAPILEGISKDFADEIKVYKIDTQKERELAGVFQVSGIPAFLYIPLEGKPVMMSGIGRTTEETKKLFEDNIQKILLTNN